MAQQPFSISEDDGLAVSAGEGDPPLVFFDLGSCWKIEESSAEYRVLLDEGVDSPQAGYGNITGQIWLALRKQTAEADLSGPAMPACLRARKSTRLNSSH